MLRRGGDVAKRYLDLRVIRLTLLCSPCNRNADRDRMAGVITVGDRTSIATWLLFMLVYTCLLV